MTLASFPSASLCGVERTLLVTWMTDPCPTVVLLDWCNFVTCHKRTFLHRAPQGPLWHATLGAGGHKRLLPPYADGFPTRFVNLSGTWSGCDAITRRLLGVNLRPFRSAAQFGYLGSWGRRARLRPSTPKSGATSARPPAIGYPTRPRRT